MTVLIVDDDPENLYLLESILSGIGHRIISAQNGKLALERLKTETPELIISDILMPELDGFQFCRVVKEDEKLRTIPFVFYTASYTDNQDEELGLKLGADLFLCKPMEPEKFILAIQKVIDKAKKPAQGNEASPYGEKELLKLFNARLVKKLEEKLAELEAEVAVRRQAELDLKKALEELEALKNRIEEENVYLQEEIKLSHNFTEIIGNSKPLVKMLEEVEQVSKTDATVLILGETGTGKELVARAINELSDRNKKTLVKVNCSALPPNLIESELFGHEKGAFTGALSQKIGRFELAHYGTLFLDEIGDLPLDIQVKLLRVLQEGEFERLGSSKTIKVDVRIIAATNRDLNQMVQQGRFREDLFYRLNVFPIYCPPLRERRSDIGLLTNYFVNKYSQKLGKKINTIPKKIMSTLINYDWPGNVRELENIIERALVTSKGSTLQIGDWFHSAPISDEGEPLLSLDEMEKRHILTVLEKTRWRIRGANGAAEILGVRPTTLESRMKRLGIRR